MRYQRAKAARMLTTFSFMANLKLNAVFISWQRIQAPDALGDSLQIQTKNQQDSLRPEVFRFGAVEQGR
jgi:hypothetical protein